ALHRLLGRAGGGLRRLQLVDRVVDRGDHVLRMVRRLGERLGRRRRRVTGPRGLERRVRLVERVDDVVQRLVDVVVAADLRADRLRAERLGLLLGPRDAAVLLDGALVELIRHWTALPRVFRFRRVPFPTRSDPIALAADRDQVSFWTWVMSSCRLLSVVE